MTAIERRKRISLVTAWLMTMLAIALLGAFMTFGTARAAVSTPAARAAVAAPAARRHLSIQTRTWRWALARRGDWYAWGGTGPSTFDCSGLVMEAALHGAGIALPRTTTEMLGSWHLVRVSARSVRKGDLAFYGSGHVELYVSARVTYGAQQSGTRIGYHRWLAGSAWQPTAYFRLVR
jgi:cell wall-associated NlpC family hydrolase